MKQQTKFDQKQEQAAEQHARTQAIKEFSNADELLRFDAAQTVVPPGIAARLKRTVGELAPVRPAGWLKRFFGGQKL